MFCLKIRKLFAAHIQTCHSLKRADTVQLENIKFLLECERNHCTTECHMVAKNSDETLLFFYYFLKNPLTGIDLPLSFIDFRNIDF